MIEKLQHFFKDPARVTKLAVGLFFLFVLLTAYLLFMLKSNLVYQGGMIDTGRANGVIIKISIIIGLGFAICYAVIHYQQVSRKETVVYLDKKTENTAGQQGSGEGTTQGSFNAGSIREALSKAKNRDEKFQQGLNQICHQLSASQGALYWASGAGEKKSFEMKSGFALVLAEGEQNPSFGPGEGLIGQVGASGKDLYLDELPEGYAARIESGLGSALPKFLFILPVKKENDTVGVIEVATFAALSETARKQAREAGNILAEIQ